MKRGTRHSRSVGHIWGTTVIALLAVALLAVIGWQLSKWPPEPADAPVSNAQPAPKTQATAEKIDTVVVFGDSYAAGTGASKPTASWVSLLATDLGWAVENVARGGTGYVAASAPVECGRDACPNFAKMVQQASMEDPDAVLVSGGRNDVAALTGTQAGVDRFFDVLRDRYPDAELIVVSPVWDDDQPPSQLEALHERVRVATMQADGTFLDIDQPLAKPGLIAPDGLHPNDAGHAALAEAVLKAFKRNDLL